MKETVGILATACHLPAHKRTVKELFQEEGIVSNDEIAARLADMAGSGEVLVSRTTRDLAVALVDVTQQNRR